MHSFLFYFSLPTCLNYRILKFAVSWCMFCTKKCLFQVDNTPLWQNWINSIMNWSMCCSETAFLCSLETWESLCERCTCSVVVCYHFSGWNQFHVVENWAQTGLKMGLTVLDLGFYGWNNGCSFIYIVCSKDFHQHRMDFQLKIELKWMYRNACCIYKYKYTGF